MSRTLHDNKQASNEVRKALLEFSGKETGLVSQLRAGQNMSPAARRPLNTAKTKFIFRFINTKHHLSNPNLL
jgi:hypothetical protein